MQANLIEDAIVLLGRLDQESPELAVARAWAREVEGRHPGARLTVLCQEEQFDGRLHLDLLVRPAGKPALYLGRGSADCLPWAMRGVQRWDRDHLLRVNHIVLYVGRALACLPSWFEDAGIQRRLVDVCLIDEALEEEPIELSDDERQEALDAYRRGKGLLGIAETEAWLTEHGLTLELLETHAVSQSLVARLRRRVCAERLGSWLERHGDRYRSPTLAVAAIADADTARSAYDAVSTGRVGFYEAVEGLARRGEAALATRGLCATDEPVFAAAARAAAAGDVLAPFAHPRGVLWATVIASAPASLLDAVTRDRVEEDVFREWLDERRARAEVRWNHGKVSSARRPLPVE